MFDFAHWKSFSLKGVMGFSAAVDREMATNARPKSIKTPSRDSERQSSGPDR
jgi:hypothetical protein